MKKGGVHIGCSGWNYDHWKGVFYPAKSSPENWFAEYSKIFSSVEINNTFYQLPEGPVFDKWHDQAPAGFIYSVKANRFITHMKKLKDPEDPVERFLGRAGRLREHLGPVLFQLPPHWKLNAERLDAFTGVLPRGGMYVFEFRDPSWYDEAVYDILSGRGISVCRHDMEGSVSPDLWVGPVCYMRFHGTTSKYGGKYDKSDLRDRAAVIREAAGQGKEVYAYFNNDAEANAPKDALKLMEILGK